MNNRNQNKVKRNAIALETKIAILKRLAEGEGSTALGKEFNLGESTIRSIQKRASKINESKNCATSESGKRASYSRNILIEKTEKDLIHWIKDSSQKRIPINGPLVKEKAKQYFNHLKDLEPSAHYKHLNFSASNGWLAGFLRRHALHNVKAQGEATFVEMLRDETVNDDDDDSAVINHLTEHAEPEAMNADEIYAGIELCSKLEEHFLKIDNDFERSFKFQKELRSCISGYCDVYKQLIKRPASQKRITDQIVTNNKSILISSSDESDLEPVCVLEYEK